MKWGTEQWRRMRRDCGTGRVEGVHDHWHTSCLACRDALDCSFHFPQSTFSNEERRGRRREEEGRVGGMLGIAYQRCRTGGQRREGAECELLPSPFYALHRLCPSALRLHAGRLLSPWLFVLRKIQRCQWTEQVIADSTAEDLWPGATQRPGHQLPCVARGPHQRRSGP